MKGPATKYKLFSSASPNPGEKRPCAFFLSPAGCRSGDNCKFAHADIPAVQGGTSPNERVDTSSSAILFASPRAGVSSSPGSVVSSESSVSSDHSMGEVHERTGGRMDVLGSTAKPAGASQPVQTNEAGGAPGPHDGSKNTKKRKNRKKNKESEGSNPFANPAKKQKPDETKPLMPSAFLPIDSTANPKEGAKKAADAQKLPTYASFASPPKTGVSKPSTSKLDFRSLNLPVAPFPISVSAPDSRPANSNKRSESTEPKAFAVSPPSPPPSAHPLPLSSEVGRKWVDLVKKTRENPRFVSAYELSRYKAMDKAIGYGENLWVSAKPYGAWCSELPQAIAVDCEMCETQDPVTGCKDPRALCRISIVDAETREVLLDSLVKPNWPVVNHRTFVNGITEEHLESVKFTLRHAQAFLLALCSQETVMIGHALQNDLAAMRLEHYCVVDSSHLYGASDNADASVSLRDLAATVLKQTMPEVHDSVNDAKTALDCVKHYHECNGEVDKIVRTFQNRPNYGAQLFLHRVPKNCETSHISQMFLAHTCVQPLEVDEIVYSGEIGKTHVHFRSTAHAKLAFDCLESKVETDATGRLQKKVFLRSGGYVRVRKMAFERPKQTSDGEEKKDGDAKAVSR